VEFLDELNDDNFLTKDSAPWYQRTNWKTKWSAG